MEAKARKIINEVLETYSIEYDIPMRELPIIELEISKRIFRSLGTCQYSHYNFTAGRRVYKIKISYKRFVGLESSDAFADTVKHELAHALQHNVDGKWCFHGNRWKYFCNIVGCKPLAYADEEAKATINKVENRFQYSCKCGRIHEVGKTIHRKISVLGKNYTCKHCNGRIFFK